MQLRPFAWLLAALCWTPAAQADDALVIGTNNTPLDRKVLALVGQESFRRAGLEMKLVSLPSERGLVAANLGAVDGEGLRVGGLTSQYPNLVLVPERFSRVSFVAFAKDATINLETGWDGLKPYRIAFINGWKLFEANATGARLVHKVDRPEQMFRMLDEGRVDIVLYTHTDGIALARELGLSSVAPLAPPLREVDMYLYLNRRHEHLVPRLTQALREIKADGTYNRLLAAIH